MEAAVSYTSSNVTAPGTATAAGCRAVRRNRASALSMAARVPAVNRSGPPGPRPTTTTRGRPTMVLRLAGADAGERVDRGGGGRGQVGPGRCGDESGVARCELTEATVDRDVQLGRRVREIGLHERRPGAGHRGRQPGL